MRAKVSKSERYLLVLTVIFLCVLAALFYRDSQVGQSGTYTFTTERTAQETVAPEPLLIDINTASAEELDQLPGIGAVIAQRIVDYRQANGSFASIEEIMEVKGIGESTFADIRDSITVGETK